MTQRTVMLLVTAAVIFAAAVAGHGQTDGALRWKIKQLQAELTRLQGQAATHAQLEADLENERHQKDAARQLLASVQQQLRDAQTSMVQGQEREAALQQDLSQAQQRLARAEAEAAQSQGAQQALVGLQDELVSTQSALAEEQERHRTTRRTLAGVRQALEQASAAVVKLRWAQTRQDQANAVTQAAMQAELMEAQQRQWQAEQELAGVRQSRDANLENERRQKTAARQTLASVQQQLRDAQASMVQGQEREAALQQDLSQAQQRLAHTEANSVDAQVAQQALASLRGELASARSALAEEQERHRTTRRTLAGVRLALEQASAAVVKLRWAQTRQDQANAVALAAMQADLIDAQQRQWRAEQDTVSIRQELSRTNVAAAGLQAQVASARDEASDAQEALAAARRKVTGLRAALAEERSRYGATGQVLSSTQQALAEKQLELDGVSRVAAVRQGMLASVQQQLRDAQTSMVQNQERQAGLEQTLAQTQQDLAQANAAAEQAQGEIARQARMNEVRQSRMNRDLMEARSQDEAVRLILASVREELARTRRSLEQEQGRNAAQGEVLSNTQAALSETSASLAEARATIAEQTEAHASAQAAAQSDKQQWVERYWDMEQQRNETRQAMKRAEQAYAETQQTLDQTTRQARIDEIRQSQLSRDLTEARAQVETTQAALSETSASLAEARATMAEQTEAHASAQAAAQSDKQQWVERFWDMEQQRNETRQAMRRAEQAYAETRQALDRMNEPAAGVTALADQVRQRFADEIGQDQLSLRVGRRGVKLVSADIFDFARTVELGRQSVQTLDRLAEMLQEMPAHQVRFAVHTDNIPLRRGARWPSNWELATARAAKLARYLIDKGVAGERLSIAGYGEYRPVADNSTPEGRQQNRRVEVIIKPPRKR